MLIDLKYLKKKYNLKIKGIIHVGAHTGEEYSIYRELGIKKIVWIEAIKELAYGLAEKLEIDNNSIVIWATISDKNGYYAFHITNNLASSSLLKLGTHLKHHPHIHNSNSTIVETYKLDSIIEVSSIKINNYNMLNLDIQGTELMALKGMGKNLKHIKYIYTEVNTEEVYKGCCLMKEIDEYLTDFKRVETKITKYCWGDALYCRK